ncbi:MAG TPA: HAD family hydrolase [Pseudogracilibacillus sp.]|nr:HAD family hydrolase [Pseudogracilibacillus sp.]
MVRCLVNGEKEYEIDGILFDKDGTLINFESLWLGWTEAFLEMMATKASLNQTEKYAIAERIGFHFKKQTWDVKGPLYVGSSTELTAVCAFCLYQHGFFWDEAVELMHEIFSEMNAYEGWENTIQPTKGLLHLLERARNHSLNMGVVTADDYHKAKRHLEKLAIASYFETISAADQVEKGKPFPDMVHKACEKMDVLPERMILIGDSNGDMVLGKNGGVQANIGFVTDKSATEQHYLTAADKIIDDFSSITFHR